MAEDFDMQSVVSDNIAAVGYNEETRQLRVQFNHRGSLYEYENVSPEVFSALLNSGSVGSYFDSEIKRNPGAYPYRRVA